MSGNFNYALYNKKKKKKKKKRTIASPLPWKFKAWPWVTMARDA
jgi:hypothetical protein